MDKKSRVLLWVLGLLIVGSVGFTYWRIMIKKDYIIDMQADCDPTTQKCFVSVCDPATDTTCTGDPDKDTSYYQKVDRLAANIPLCDPADETCQAMVCPDGEKDCTVTFCDDQTKGKDDTCSDPDTYNAAHPATDDSAAGDGTTCDPAQDPTCVTSDSSGDGAGATDTTASDGSSSDGAASGANQQ